ncbi:MAG: hypothetical protein JSR45_01140 [Proteobacteria bacterium]|nr:hypothetical protein [Pseudomonadota bacterium]
MLGMRKTMDAAGAGAIAVAGQAPVGAAEAVTAMSEVSAGASGAASGGACSAQAI